MGSSTVRQEFGTDFGLVHEFVVTGRKVGADRDFYAKLAHDEALFGQVVSMVKEGKAVKPAKRRGRRKPQVMTLEEAAEIFGADFHSLEAAAEFFDVSLSDELRSDFEAATCPIEVVYSLKGKCVLTPTFAMSLKGVFDEVSGQFHPDHRPNPWFGKSNQDFRLHLPEIGYVFIGKEVFGGSVRESWGSQQTLIVPPNFIPTTAAAAQAATLHRSLTGEQLFSQYWARTDDETAYGPRVGVISVSGGLNVDAWYDYASSDFGVAWARKFA